MIAQEVITGAIYQHYSGKQYKIVCNLLLIEPLLADLKSCTRKVVLYGSFANGEDGQNSDIDLYIVSAKKDAAESVIKKYSRSKKLSGKKIQTVIDTPVDLLTNDTRNQVFMDQVLRGNVLWEKPINEDNL